MHKEAKKQLRQANLSTYIQENELFVWIRRRNRRLDSFQTRLGRLGLGAIPVFNRCTGVAPIADWLSLFLLYTTKHWTSFCFFGRYASEHQNKVIVD